MICMNRSFSSRRKSEFFLYTVSSRLRGRKIHLFARSEHEIGEHGPGISFLEKSPLPSLAVLRLNLLGRVVVLKLPSLPRFARAALLHR